MAVAVALEWYECRQAELCGGLRHENAMNKGYKNKFGDREETPEQSKRKHINGAAAEIAVAKVMNRYWHASVAVFHDLADVGECIQVRWRSKDHYDLIVRDNDQDDHYFFLVTGDMELEMIVRGYILGEKAKREQWIREHGNFAPSYFVPQVALTGVALEERAS
jgi:hypothetical protein